MFVAVCAGPDRAQLLRSVGADGVEAQAAALFSPLDSDWTPPPKADLPIETTNVFFPGAVKLFEDGPDPLEVGNRAVERASRFGVKVMVLGSGGTRRRPNNVDPETAEARFAELAAALHAFGAPLGVAVAPEPLNASETNVGNAPGLLAERLRAAGAPYTTDSYHVLYHRRETEPDRPLADYLEEHVPFLPVHVHLSGADRRAPRADDPDLIAFAARLRDLGYAGRVSLEFGWTDLGPEARAGIDATRRLFSWA